MSHILDWNAAIELLLRHSREKTPPMFVRGTREHEHPPPRFRVRQGHSVNDKVLRGIPGPDQMEDLFSGQNHPVNGTRFVRRLAPAICSSRNTRRGQTTSAIRGKDVRNQFTAVKNCFSLPTVSDRLMLAKPANHSGSYLTSPCECTFRTT